MASRRLVFSPSILLLLLVICSHLSYLVAQFPRGVFQWKQDLEFRLNLYRGQYKQLQDILDLTGSHNNFRARNVAFKDLIIQGGALKMESRFVQPTLSILADRTHNYVRAKANELNQIHHRLDMVRQRLDHPNAPFFYKSPPDPADFHVAKFRGNFTLAHLVHATSVNAYRVQAHRISSDEVDAVLDKTYWRYPNRRESNRDPKNRLYFEGRKTIWGPTVFKQELRVSCGGCDSLIPIATNRMMIKSYPQNITAPVLFHTNGLFQKLPVVVRNLETPQLSNSHLTVGLVNTSPLYSAGIMRTPPENVIRHDNLVYIQARDQILDLPNKMLIIEGDVVIDEAVVRADGNMQSVIGVSSMPGVHLDLSLNNHLLRHELRNISRTQRVLGTLIVNSETHFLYGLNALTINEVVNFNNFVNDMLVRTDRPATIQGSVDFKALSSVFDRAYRGGPIPRVLMAQIDGSLQVGSLNGMRLPDDIIVTDLMGREPSREIHVHGSRHFTHRMIMRNRFTVQQLINNMSMPDGVIPLHLNDFVDTTGASNLWFIDGLSVHDVTVHSRKFDNIPLNIDASAESLILNMMLARDANGVQIIKAPLRIERLVMDSINGGGLLNGLRPEDVVELYNRDPRQMLEIGGRKNFIGLVEATDCVFTDINNISNWPSHLVRIDRPDSVQTIHTRLNFVSQQRQQPLFANMTLAGPQPPFYNLSGIAPRSSIHINRLTMDFLENTQPSNYETNFNLSPEFYMIYLALARGIGQNVDSRIRVLDLVHMVSPNPLVNGVPLSEVLRLNEPFSFPDKFVMVGRVETLGSFGAVNVTSNYPFDVMDLVQFDKFRIPIAGSYVPVRLNNLALAGTNQATFVRTHLLNGQAFTEFASSVMSLTQPQVVESKLTFMEQVSLEGLVRTSDSLNQVADFRRLTERIRNATSYSFEDGLQCNAVMIKT